MKYAEKLVEHLANANGGEGAVLYPVRGKGSFFVLYYLQEENATKEHDIRLGALGSLAIVPGHCSIVNQTFVKFLSRLPRAGTELKAPKMTTEDRMKAALRRLSELTGDKSIALREPKSALSFSCLSKDVIQNQSESIETYRRGAVKAFSPVGHDGRPIRKCVYMPQPTFNPPIPRVSLLGDPELNAFIRYSERKGDHWFSGENDGLSYAGSYSYILTSPSPTPSSIS